MKSPWQDLCFLPTLVFVGTLCTTFSSALSGLASRGRHCHFDRKWQQWQQDYYVNP
jgi:hypothetical protein